MKIDFRIRNTGAAAVSLVGANLQYSFKDAQPLGNYFSDVWWFSCGTQSNVAITVLADAAVGYFSNVFLAFDISCYFFVSCPHSNNSDVAINRLAEKLYHSGGGRISTGQEMRSMGSQDQAITGIKTWLQYDSKIAFDQRYALQWDGEYFVVDAPRVQNNTYGLAGFTLHWNFPYQPNLTSYTDTHQPMGEPKFYQYGNQGVQATYFSTVRSNYDAFIDTVSYPTSNGEYSDNAHYYPQVFQPNNKTDPSKENYHPDFATDVVFRFHQSRLSLPMSNNDLLVSIFQPHALTENPTKWVKWECGADALCLEKADMGVTKYLVMKEYPANALTVTLPDAASTQIAINQQFVGITETTPLYNGGAPTIVIHEVIQ